MSWFALKPFKLCKEALKTIDAWWTKAGSPAAMWYEIDLGKLKIYLYGTDQIGREGYRKLHDQAEIPSLAGCMWATGSGTENRYEIWLPMKLTKAGKTIINEWGTGHELMHVIDHYLSKYGIPFGDPDQVIKEEFYE